MSVISCRWDWCRSSFTTIDALDNHVKHDHIWPMKPMRKADIVLMRRMDLQSLHSSQDTDSSIIPRGLIPGGSRAKTLPAAHQSNKRPENDLFDQSSSPPPQSLPASPAFDSLISKVGLQLSAVVEMFERVQGQRRPLLPPQRSPTRRSPSDASGSSQEVVEQQLTQEDAVGSQPRSLLPPGLPSEHEHADVELTWPTDDESDALAANGIQGSEQRHHRPSDSARGQNFRCGSLNVPLGANNQNYSSQESQSQSQPVILQTQAPYSSQSMGWSQTL